jgi:hypothetical protein
VVLVCNPSIWEPKAGGSRVLGQPTKCLEKRKKERGEEGKEKEKEHP